MGVPALIMAGASILGGVLSKQKPISSGDNAYSHVEGIRKAAKDFGFNPLTLLGSVGAVGGTQGQNFMGSAIADAGMMLADGYARHTTAKAEGARNQLEQETRKLRQQLAAATIRPKIGGLYGGSILTPSLGAALGRITPGAGTAAAVAAPHVNLPAIALPDPLLNRSSGYFANGYYVPPATETSPAETMESNYGEVAGEVFGLSNLAVDSTMGFGMLPLRRWSDERGYTMPTAHYGVFEGPNRLAKGIFGDLAQSWSARAPAAPRRPMPQRRPKNLATRASGASGAW